MACELTTGFTLGCLEGIGGVKEVLIANYTLASGADFMSAVTYDAVTGEVNGLPTATIYRYVPFRNSGSYVETVNKNLETGTLFFSQEVGWTFGKLNQEMRNEFLNVAKAKMIVFVRTMKQLIDILRQFTTLDSQSVSTSTSAEAAKSLFTGVIAASSQIGKM